MKVKRNRKLMSILLTLAMLVTLLVPMVGPASASNTYTATSTPTMNAGNSGPVGQTNITVDPGSFGGGNPADANPEWSYVWLSAPSSPDNFGIGIAGYGDNNGHAGSVGSFVYTDNLTSSNYALQIGGIAGMVPTQVANVPNQMYNVAHPEMIQLYANGSDRVATVTTSGVTTTYFKQIKVMVDKRYIVNSGNQGLIMLPMAVDIPSGANGAVTMTATAPSTSGFTSGSLAIAKVGSGTVSVACESTQTVTGTNTDKSGVISIKESSQGAMETVKLTLPPGLTWQGAAPTANSFSAYWGSAAAYTDLNWSTSNGGRELDVSPKNNVDANGHFNSGSYFKFTYGITVDDSVAKQGDINLSISGNNLTTSSLVIGTYGTFGASIKALGDPTQIVAGKADADSTKLGQFEIDEAVAGSLISGRTITLTLPSGAVWAQNDTPNLDTSASTSDNVQNNFQWTNSGSDGRTLKGTFNITNNATANAAKLIFKDAKILVEADFTGDLNVTVGGTEGLTGTLKLATVAAPVTVSAASTPDVKIGMAGQALGDLTITEAGGGYLDGSITGAGLDTAAQTGATPSYLGVTHAGANSDAQLILTAPSGVTFDTVPTISVTSGDIQLDTSAITTATSTNNEGQLIIPVKSGSTTASTIKISDIKVTVDRTVPEGAVNLKLKGSAVNENIIPSGLGTATANTLDSADTTLFPNDDTAFKVQVANVATPAPVTTKATAVFTIGSTDFTLNGTKTTMDAAPYLKNDRTYLPIRFVAQAVGVSDSNIIWNSDDQSVTLIKDGSVVRLVVGSTTMTINGTPIIMDTAPEIVDPGRTMLPVSWVAKALGANITWDPATQTVTVN